MMAVGIAVECRNVKKIFDAGEEPVHALDDVSLHVRKGEFLSLFGPSGSGKTTLLNLIGGLDEPTHGEIWVGGRRIDTLSKSDRADFRLHNIGFIFQAYNLIPVLTARENVEFIMQLRGVPEKERREKSYEILKLVGLEGYENRRPAELSGGQQQRVAVSRAVVANPSVILADEPTANLDSTTAGNLLNLMRKMNEERGVTFIFSTHDKLVMEHAKRLIELHDGKIVSDNVKSGSK